MIQENDATFRSFRPNDAMSILTSQSFYNVLFRLVKLLIIYIVSKDFSLKDDERFGTLRGEGKGRAYVRDAPKFPGRGNTCLSRGFLSCAEKIDDLITAYSDIAAVKKKIVLKDRH